MVVSSNTSKKEELTGALITLQELQSSVFKYIELYYNTKYAHSALGYLSPAQSKKENP